MQEIIEIYINNNDIEQIIIDNIIELLLAAKCVLVASFGILCMFLPE